MTNSELILKLVEMLLESEKNKEKQSTNIQHGQDNDQYISNQKEIVNCRYYLFFIKNKRDTLFAVVSLFSNMTFLSLVDFLTINSLLYKQYIVNIKIEKTGNWYILLSNLFTL